MRIQHVVILATVSLFITDTSASRNLKSPSPPPVKFEDIDGEERAPTFKGLFSRGSSSKQSIAADMKKFREEAAKLDVDPEEEKKVVFQACHDYFYKKGAYNDLENILNDPGLYGLILKLNTEHKRTKVWHFLHEKYKGTDDLQKIISGADQNNNVAKMIADELVKLG